MSASVRAGSSSEDSRGVRSLASTLFSSILAFALAAVLVLAVALAGIFYAVYEKEAEEQLVFQAHEAASALDAAPASARSDILAEQFAGVIRYTLIAADGTVLFDSKADVQGMGSHADRPEVQTAEEAGEAFSARYSETAGTDTLYVAVKLGDGGVIRASEQRVSLAAFLGRMLLPVAAALCAVALLVFLLSRVLTRRIMKPVDALNFAEPLENEIYEEMRPLLARIDRQQRQLKEQNEELALAESMRRDFSSNVSHEMKTPLQVISGYAELMMNGMVQPDDRQRFAGLIYSEAQAMRSLIDDVMMLSRLDESAFVETAAPVDLLATARRAQGRLASFAERYGVTVEVGKGAAFGLTGFAGSASGAEGEDFEPGEIVAASAPVCILGNETLAEEMLYNLMENGIRYNHDGGSVRVDVSVEKSVCAKDGARAVVRVRDTGPGIPAGMEDKIFERFFRLDKSRSKETGGTGLGLAIVKHAVIYHAGTISVEAAEGGGACFVLSFPVA